MATQDDNTILSKADLKAYHQKILPFLGGNAFLSTNHSDYYSTDEKMVGVWTDGKPLYQKTITLPLPEITIDGTTVAETIPFSDSRINIVNPEMGWVECGYAIDPNTGHSIANVNTAWGNEYKTAQYFIYAAFHMNQNGIMLQANRLTNSQNPVILTVRYTKTTDTTTTALTSPGAYDLNRPDLWPVNKEIFFGNGLYGKRWAGSFTASTTWTDVAEQLDTVNLGKIQLVNRGGGIQRRGGDTVMSLGSYIESGGIGYDIWYAHDVSGQPNGFRLRGKDNGTHAEDYDIWCTYTK